MPNFTPAAHCRAPFPTSSWSSAVRWEGARPAPALLPLPCTEGTAGAFWEPCSCSLLPSLLNVPGFGRDLRLGTPKAEAAASLLQGFCLVSARGGAGGTRRWLGPSLQGEGRWVPPIPVPLAGLVNHQAPLRSVLSAWLCYGNIDLLLGLTSQSFQWAGLTVINETGWNLC